MHALLAHAYHLSQHGLNILNRPVWLACAASFLVAIGGRLSGLTGRSRGAALVAGVAVLSGWLLLDTHWGSWPLLPLERLPGLAVILLVEALWQHRRVPARPNTVTRRGKSATRAGQAHAPPRAWLTLVVVSALAAWWARGAPLDGPRIVHCMPVFLGLAGALPLARRAALGDTGWGHASAALALATSMLLAGVAAHWARAGLPPLIAALMLLGVDGMGAVLPGAVVMLAADAMVASDRGRLIPVDIACLVPLLAWPLTHRLSVRIGRVGPAASALLAAGLCAGLAWAVKRAMWG